MHHDEIATRGLRRDIGDYEEWFSRLLGDTARLSTNYRGNGRVRGNGAKSGGGSSGGIGAMMFVFYAYSVELNRIVVCMIAVGIVAYALDRGLRAVLAWSMPWAQ